MLRIILRICDKSAATANRRSTSYIMSVRRLYLNGRPHLGAIGIGRRESTGIISGVKMPDQISKQKNEDVPVPFPSDSHSDRNRSQVDLGPGNRHYSWCGHLLLSAPIEATSPPALKPMPLRAPCPFPQRLRAKATSAFISTPLAPSLPFTPTRSPAACRERSLTSTIAKASWCIRAILCWISIRGLIRLS